MKSKVTRTKKNYFASASKGQRAGVQIFNIANANPYTDIDYTYFENVWAGTLAGSALDKLIEFVIGTGVKPKFTLIDEKDKEDDQIQEELNQYEDLKQQLIQFDQLDKINFKQNLFDCAVMAKTFGRVALAFEPSGAALPTALKIIHPRDLGYVNIDQDDWSVVSVDTADKSDTIEKDDMVYFVNRPNNPVRRNLWYGYSEMQRVVGAARALQRLVEYDGPEIAQAMWAGYGLIIVDTEGKGPPATVINNLLDGLKPGAFNAISGKKDDVTFMPLDLHPRIAELTQLTDMYERLIIGNFGVPAALLGREEDSNMATLFGKIRLFLGGPVMSAREWLAEIIGKQWYSKILLKLEGGEEAMKKIRVTAEFDPIVLESWVDNIDGALMLSSAVPDLPQDVILDILGLDQYKEDLNDNIEKNQQMKQKEQQQAHQNNMELQKSRMNPQMSQVKKTASAMRDKIELLRNSAIKKNDADSKKRLVILEAMDKKLDELNE